MCNQHKKRHALYKKTHYTSVQPSIHFAHRSQTVSASFRSGRQACAKYQLLYQAHIAANSAERGTTDTTHGVHMKLSTIPVSGSLQRCRCVCQTPTRLCCCCPNTHRPKYSAACWLPRQHDRRAAAQLRGSWGAGAAPALFPKLTGLAFLGLWQRVAAQANCETLLH